ncbi:suppressor of los1-1, partial [Clonorchis sinensis]
CENFIRIFTHLERAELNQNDLENYRICGQLNQLPQTTFYSVGRVLIVEMQGGRDFTKSAQLHGSYRFEDKSWYQNDGIPVPETTCDRLFLSPGYFRNLPTQKGEKESGRFFSHTYPQNIPSNLTCKYYFLGNVHERILLSLYDVVLPGREPCSNTSREDSIRISEFILPSYASSELLLLEIRKTNLQKLYPLRRICSNATAIQIPIDKPGAILEFDSTENSMTARGFKGRFRFILQPNDFPLSSAGISNGQDDDSDLSNAQSEQSYGAEDKPIIKEIWMNKNERTGLIESPNYPAPYPANIQILYIFHIPTDTNLQLNFLDFRLSDYSQSRHPVVGGDRLEVYEGPAINNKPKLTLFGNHIPDELQRQLSPKAVSLPTTKTYTLRFLSDHIAAGNGRGFLLSYEYGSTKVDDVNLPKNAKNPPDSIRIPSELIPSPHQINLPGNTDDCQFTIRSNGQDVFGKLPLPRHPTMQIFTSKHARNGYNSSCRWKLQGNPGQRIRLRLLRRKAKGAAGGPQFQTSFIQHDEEAGSRRTVAAQPELPDMEENHKPPFRQLRCPTPLTVELINYLQEGRTGANPVHLRSASDTTALIGSAHFGQKDRHYQIQSPLIPSDPVFFCADESAMSSPAGKGFMSGHIPRMDIVLRVNRMMASNKPIKAFETIPNFPQDLDYDIEYQFVTDYGVTAPFGVQRKPGCQFEFNLSMATKGNFSSPNYPGLYPIDITCEYRFSGNNVRKIEIEFLEFDVESASKTCSDARMGDYVELRSCYPLELLTYPKRRLCHQQTADNRYHIEWYEPCVLLKFFSNEHFAGTGFFGLYTFYTSGELFL